MPPDGSSAPSPVHTANQFWVLIKFFKAIEARRRKIKLKAIISEGIVYLNRGDSDALLLQHLFVEEVGEGVGGEEADGLLVRLPHLPQLLRDLRHLRLLLCFLLSCCEDADGRQLPFFLGRPLYEDTVLEITLAMIKDPSEASD